MKTVPCTVAKFTHVTSTPNLDQQRNKTVHLKDVGEINSYMRNRGLIQPSQYSLGNTFPAEAEERRSLSPTVWLL
jgi:hypothetical protein